MAKARKCDRCGKFFMPEELREHFENDETVYFVVNSIYNFQDDSTLYDLCVNCHDELKKWMEAKKK